MMADNERIKEARRRYQREYRKAHPDKVKQWQENFWAKYGEKTKVPVENGFLESSMMEVSLEPQTMEVSKENDFEERKSNQ